MNQNGPGPGTDGWLPERGVLIHVGPPKTGTTALQSSLADDGSYVMPLVNPKRTANTIPLNRASTNGSADVHDSPSRQRRSRS